MFISVFDIFKIGIGPSSSHTMGPMTAALLFLKSLAKTGAKADRIRVSLHGSLAFTGKGHATDRAIILGLAGFTAETAEATEMATTLTEIHDRHRIAPQDFPPFRFDPNSDLIFDYGPSLPGHANGMCFSAFAENGSLLMQQTYYSIGGGFVVLAEDLNNSSLNESSTAGGPAVPYPFNTADEMLAAGKAADLSVAEMKRANELGFVNGRELDDRLDRVWRVMSDSIDRGLAADGILPGGLKLKRRAKELFRQLEKEMAVGDRHLLLVNEWLVQNAIAVSEENAAGGKIVTAPTNGAAGVIPAVISYYLAFYSGATPADVRTFLLVAAAIGGIIKHNGSISGAEVGCQGEIGSAAAMAAAGLCAVLGGTNEQIENSAEIALEHHLGMTCDPVNGLVQVPCIERNGFGAVKAVTAATLALRGDGSHLISLDKCIRTMYQTGLDMNDKYKETSRGGLAVNLVDC
ncbi:MAG: serine dehydratase [Desulfobulbaceae bacterium BRH_c16a]|nr:MAG: serine dehydratase [Desulfobulbaceae bacterium BRH_c16a]